MENDVTVCTRADNTMMGPLILFCALASVATTSIPPNGVDVTTQSDVVWTDANWANGLFPLVVGALAPLLDLFCFAFASTLSTTVPPPPS
jgi:hypothetical protein